MSKTFTDVQMFMLASGQSLNTNNEEQAQLYHRLINEEYNDDSLTFTPLTHESFENLVFQKSDLLVVGELVKFSNTEWVLSSGAKIIRWLRTKCGKEEASKEKETTPSFFTRVCDVAESNTADE